eukprot:COSAG01_NODE_542_length_15693_cov_13.246253_17_plen_175_part_00
MTRSSEWNGPEADELVMPHTRRNLRRNPCCSPPPCADEPGQKRSKSAGSFEQEPPRRSLDYVLQRAGAVQPCYWYIHAEAVCIMLGYASTQEMEDELGGGLAHGWDGADAWISRHGELTNVYRERGGTFSLDPAHPKFQVLPTKHRVIPPSVQHLAHWSLPRTDARWLRAQASL